MTKQALSRRQFLVGCSSAIAALAGARLTQLSFAATPDGPSATQEILIVIFLRGGWDALNVVMPLDGPDRGAYLAARPELSVPASGTGAALRLNALFGLHPSAAPVYDLYQQGHLAVVHAAGLTSDTRSHFDAMQYIELGTPGQKSTSQGWLARHLASSPVLPVSVFMPAVSVGSSEALSLLGSREAISMDSPSQFTFSGHWQYADFQRIALRKMYNGDHWLYHAGTRTLDAADLVESASPGSYTPANGATYPSGSFGDALKTVAQLIKLNLGLHVATVDLGGWDTHEDQGDGSGGYFATLLGNLANGLKAFYKDLDGSGSAAYAQRLTVVVQSEFGRRLKENASHGTDHGHGNVMLVMGGGVNGGQVYGEWPGLQGEQLYDGQDLAVATDYRRVFGEIIERRLNNPNLDVVFPGYTGYAPLGIVRLVEPPLPVTPRLTLPVILR